VAPGPARCAVEDACAGSPDSDPTYLRLDHRGALRAPRSQVSAMSSHLPGPTGLYRPDAEHDACGVSFVVDLHGRRSHELVRKGLTSLRNLDHRGATGAEPN